MRIGSNIANEFNDFSVNYTEDMVRCVPHYLRLLSLFTEGLPVDFSPKRILDLGCGNGNVTFQLLHTFPQAQYTLLDASEKMIDLCKSRFHQVEADYAISYFKDFSFKENYYDLIVAGFSLHHCEGAEKRELFKKIHHSLQPGGIFSFSDLMIDKNSIEHPPFLKGWESFVYNNYSDGEKWQWLMEHYNEFDKPDALDNQLEWLMKAGFTFIEPTALDTHWVHIRAEKN
ncbi:ubiquinone/menaquinone biosynthesis C-methylase UbiE [Ulvibacter sp. MAR_2010_11]|uniref:class I SAM-dependent methyltransferase n=1 Tax=Ulvibacter sp. MAR_2010_11 TaxID=1250229 RepID=UPI000C2B53DE|nr:class I SAM-dependent methyltransferase [Ulvibacter sp. MAR_2010_11]PKA82605.1 ubiquinone/menaquinone biosynthesis C-methylase UbiE [Ulvibacter sp. MAR_2010_11]